MEDDTKSTVTFFLNSWLEEATSSCDTFLENINKPFSFDDPFHKRRMFEEHYVLTATVMSIRFAKQLVNHAKKPLKDQLEAFIEETQLAVDVRDMREHSDEYFTGKGRKKASFYQGSENGLEIDMSSSIQNEHGYMLGNVISMEEISKKCSELLQALPQNSA